MSVFNRWGAIAGLALACIAHPAAFAATPPERRAMDFTQAVCDAFKNADVAALEKFLAPEFTLVGSDASVQSREQTLAEVRSGEPRYTRFENHDVTAHVYGDAAVVQGVTSLEGTYNGKRFNADVRFTDTLVRMGGRWRIVVSHVTRIAKG
jgi:ketosteroid isomerase-like protein